MRRLQLPKLWQILCKMFLEFLDTYISPSAIDYIHLFISHVNQ